MAIHGPQPWTPLASMMLRSDSESPHLAHPGVFAVIIVVNAVLIWHMCFPVIASPSLAALLVMQILLFSLSYRFPIPSLPVLFSLIVLGDLTMPLYSSYALYPLIIALGLWSYLTNDIAAAVAVTLCSLYQLIWMHWATSAFLFSMMFVLIALLSCGVRHLFIRLERERARIRQMRTRVHRSAIDLHDAVSGGLTRVDLLLQQGVPSAEQCTFIRGELDAAGADVACIVDLLLEQVDDTRVTDPAQIRRLRRLLAEHDEKLFAAGVHGRSNLIGDVVLCGSDERRLVRCLATIYDNTVAMGAQAYELSLSVTTTGMSITQICTGVQGAAGVALTRMAKHAHKHGDICGFGDDGDDHWSLYLELRNRSMSHKSGEVLPMNNLS